MNYRFKYRPLALALYEALSEDAFYVAMEKSASGSLLQRKAAMLRYYDYSTQAGRRYGALFATNGQAAGASVWSQPLSDDICNTKQPYLDESGGQHAETR